MSELSILEIAKNSKINLENVIKLNPVLENHPIFVIAMDQLNEVIKRLEENAK